MATYGFIFDQTRCIGCNACQMACKDGHDLELGLFFRRAETFEIADEKGNMQTVHYSGACNHCSAALCAANCPTGAMHKQSDGTIAPDPEMCIGCGTCTWVCPYGAPKLSRVTGRSMKCDACFDRRQEGKQPLCVEACITHCLKFVDLDTLTEEEKSKYTSALPFLPDPKLTKPNLLVLKKEEKND